jgi:hypothetical protein
MPRSIDAHRSDCPCPACRSRQGRATRPPLLGVRLPQEVQDWLRAQPEGPTAWITAQVEAAQAPADRFEHAHHEVTALIAVLAELLSRGTASHESVEIWLGGWLRGAEQTRRRQRRRKGQPMRKGARRPSQADESPPAGRGA